MRNAMIRGIMKHNDSLEVSGDVIRNRKSGFDIACEGNQEFPPKTVSVKKLDVVFDAGSEEAVVVKPAS